MRDLWLPKTMPSGYGDVATTRTVAAVDVLRTPDDRFAGLLGWTYEPHYTDVPQGDGAGALRIHHVDEGPPGAPPILCLHGEPSWGYLYRKMIPPLVAAGHRVLVPDLVGFGRSDKPTARTDYTYQRHVDWMAAWLAANTFLPTGDRPAGEAFLAWQKYSQEAPDFNVGRIVQGGCLTRPLPAEVVAAYDAPFPDDRYKAGARQFPLLVPTSPDDPAIPANRAAWDALGKWEKPCLAIFGQRDRLLGKADRPLIKHIPGAVGQPHARINASHFIQEDSGPELAERILSWLQLTAD